MSIEQLWAQAKEEFGDEAHKRFIVERQWVLKYNFPFDDNYTVECASSCDGSTKPRVTIKPLPDLISHDIEWYGNNAYLMWETYHTGLIDECRDLQRNIELKIKPMDWFALRRKTSAALPFDLERAKAGDVVEVLDYGDIGEGWTKFEMANGQPRKYGDLLGSYVVILNGQLSATITTLRLRMKYPPKASNGQG